MALVPCVHCGKKIAGGTHSNTQCPNCGGYQRHEGLELLGFMGWTIGVGTVILMLIACCSGGCHW